MRVIARPASKVCVDYEPRDERKWKFRNELLLIEATMCPARPVDMSAKRFGDKEVKK